MQPAGRHGYRDEPPAVVRRRRLQRLVSVARGDEPADLVLVGGRVLSVFTREWLQVDVAVVDGRVAGLGRYRGKEVLDVEGRFVIPGFIDAHMHFETTRLLPDEFARLESPRQRLEFDDLTDLMRRDDFVGRSDRSPAGGRRRRRATGRRTDRAFLRQAAPVSGARTRAVREAR